MVFRIMESRCWVPKRKKKEEEVEEKQGKKERKTVKERRVGSSGPVAEAVSSHSFLLHLEHVRQSATN